MKKLIIAALLGAVSVVQGTVISFDNLNGDVSGLSIDGKTTSHANVSASSAFDGLDIVYSLSIASQDLDGGGTGNDTLSWDIRFAAFNNGTKTVNGNDSSVTLGTHWQTAVGGTNFKMADDGDAVEDWDNNDSLRFTVENIVLATDIGGYTAVFDGFDSAYFSGSAGTDYIFGEGTGLDSVNHTATGNLAFGPYTTLTVTADTNNRAMRQLDGQFSIIPEPGTLGLMGAFGGSLLFIRRSMKK